MGTLMAWALPAQSGLEGRVRFEPPFPKVRVDKALLSEEKCRGCWTGEPLRDDLVVDADGRFAVQGLPAGKYTLTGWHERMEKQEVEVEVPAKVALDLVLKLRP